MRHHLSAGGPRRVDRPRQRRGRAVPFINFLRIFSFISKELFFFEYSFEMMLMSTSSDAALYLLGSTRDILLL